MYYVLGDPRVVVADYILLKLIWEGEVNSAVAAAKLAKL